MLEMTQGSLTSQHVSGTTMAENVRRDLHRKLRPFGMTPHQYVINCRVNAARAALDQGAPLTEIALRFGFTDLSHFNRRFKRIYGMTPYQYQRDITR